jgi:peptide deformylase
MPAPVIVEKKKLENPPRQIHFLGDRTLRQPAKRVAKVDEEIRLLVKEMFQTMYSSNGIGLAAPQVGVHKQVIVIDIEPDKPEVETLVLINPVIKKLSRQVCDMEEGCLSVPNVFIEVTRPEEVEVSYKDELGHPRTLKARGLLSRVIQHEMDHLQGVLFVDRVENELLLTEELRKNKFSPSAVKPIK